MPDAGDHDVMRIQSADEFESIACRILPSSTYGYVAGGAGSEAAVRRNRESLARLLLVPRVLQGLAKVETGTTVLGHPLSFPLIVAPSAVQRLAHPDGELATARAVHESGLLMILSMNSSTSVEDVGEVGAPLWMQLYFSGDRGHMREVVHRAQRAGVKALCVTVDHAGMPTRPRELRQPLEIPTDIAFPHLVDRPSELGIDRSLSWDTVEWLRGVTDLPLVLKGILHPADALLAAQRQVAAIIVSNHGGRQLDGVVSGYDVLPAIVDATDGRCEVLVDGGIRSGTDLMKALALGARAALVGRPIWWSLAVGGQSGVARLIDLLRSDFTESMWLSGCASTQQVGPELLWGLVPTRDS